MDSTDSRQPARRTRAERSPQAGRPGETPGRKTEEAAARVEASAAPAGDTPEGLAQPEEIEAFVNLGRWSWDMGTGAIGCSTQLLRIFGLASAELLRDSDSLLKRVHPGDRARVRASIMRALNTGEPFQFQHRIVRPDEHVRVLRTRGAVEIRDPDGPKCLRGISQDITEVHAVDTWAKERLKRAARRVQDRNENERGRIARQLRDELTEPLATLGRKLASLNACGPASEAGPVASQIEDCLRVVNGLVATSLEITEQLRPTLLEERGLFTALRTEAMRIGRRAAIPVNVAGENIEPRLPIGIEAALYRLAGEAISNAARHAGCTLIRVSLSGSASHTRLEIQDNGTGFDAKAVEGTASDGTGGLTLMRENAEALSASFRVSSQPGAGARITVEYRG